MKGNRVYVQHIFDAILAIEKFLENIPKKEFLKSDLIQSAVMRKIEIMGEASKNLKDTFKRRYNLIPWKRIAGMRDKLIHQYFGVDVERVWEVTQKDIPLIKEQIYKIVKEIDKKERRNARK